MCALGTELLVVKKAVAMPLHKAVFGMGREEKNREEDAGILLLKCLNVALAFH